MKRILLMLFAAANFTSMAQAFDSTTAGKEWGKLNQELIDGKLSPVRSHQATSNLRDGEKCFDRNGKNVNAESCDDVDEFVRVMSRKSEGDCARKSIDQCISMHEEILSSIDSRLDKISLANSFIRENLSEYLKVAPQKLRKVRADVSASLDDLKDPTGAGNRAVAKIRSKECKISRLETSICQKSQVDSAANWAMEMEKESTKQSGVVNRYGRHKAGQLKAMHGTGQLGELKSQYRKLSGKDWNPKACEADDELEACGCIQDGSSQNDCPRGGNGLGKYLE